MRITDWDDAYANGAYIPDTDRLMAAWLSRSEALRKAEASVVLRYGDRDRNHVDLYRPAGTPRGLIFYVHGGYWHLSSGREQAFLAAGGLARGFAVAMVSYTLAPDIRVSGITAEVARALHRAAAEIAGPIYLTGHSAGGHLASRMMCEGVLGAELVARIAHVVSISGVHDLRPLLNTTMNEILRLDTAEAVAESPALQRPVNAARITCVVGSAERPEFLRQNDLLANIWTGLGADTAAVHLSGLHHFNVIDGLAEPDSALMRLFVDHMVS